MAARMSGMEYQTLVQLARDESIRMMEKCENNDGKGLVQACPEPIFSRNDKFPD